MARTGEDRTFPSSLLERITDQDPEITGGPRTASQVTLRHFKQELKRDLEWLLNCRRTYRDLPAELNEVHRSLWEYGLPDFSTTNPNSSSEQIRLLRQLETAISYFEPRLHQISVTIEPNSEPRRILHFHIHAQLAVKPSPEPITFDTVFHLHKSEFTIREP